MASPLTTPLEPGAASAVATPAHTPARGQQWIHSTALRRIETAAASTCGSQHASNEDAHSPLTGSGSLFVVADGVGGGALAQMASRQLVAQLHAALDGRPVDADAIRNAMREADRNVARRIARVTDSPGAATVVLCAPVNALASKWLIAWVGDCRAYRFTKGSESRIDLLTRDDTFSHLNETPPRGGSPDDPARMVGNGAIADANVSTHSLSNGDMLMLCSDGVHKFVGADEMRRLLDRSEPLAQCCEELIALARAQGSTDDATVLLLRRAVCALPRPRWFTRWFSREPTRRAPR